MPRAFVLPFERRVFLAPLRLLLFLGMIGVAAHMSTLVDRGFTRDWPPAGRAAWVAVMMLLILNGIVRAIGLGFWLLGERDEGPLPPSLRGYLNVFTAFGLSLCTLLIVAPYLDLDIGRAVLGACGVFIGVLGGLRPRWFVEHSGVQLMDRLLRPTGTRLLYIALGLGLLIAAVTGYGMPHS